MNLITTAERNASRMSYFVPSAPGSLRFNVEFVFLAVTEETSQTYKMYYIRRSGELLPVVKFSINIPTLITLFKPFFYTIIL